MQITPSRFSRWAVRFTLLSALAWNAAASAPQIWFAPLDDVTRQNNVTLGIIPSSDGGPTDYMNLFVPGAQWSQAAGRVAVFKIYNTFGKLPDSSLQQIFSFLKQHNIDLALEFGPLTPTGGCGVGIEGFSGQSAKNTVDWITRNGGTLKYVVMDEPFYFANVYSGTGACHWTAQQVAANAVTSLNILKAAFPGLVVGDVEPVSGNGKASDWLQRYAGWMDAFQAATGTKLAFFHSDTILSIPTWMTDLVALRAETSKRNIPFGIIYDGFLNDTSDAQWTTHAEQFFTAFELANGTPDQAIFQSWEAFPKHVLPESTPYTFTWLIDRYLRPRTSLSLNVMGAQATGKLLDAQGNGLSAQSVSVAAQPTSGAGIVATYTLTGTVPATISKALVQMCVNLCGSQGTNNMSVYSFQYADSSAQSALDFSKQLAGWVVNGNGTGSVQLGTDASGPFLHVSSTPSQFTFVNSPSFTVTPGSAYTLTVKARISPDSPGSGYFALIFLADKEVSRDTLAYAPGTESLGTAQTASDGSYGLSFTPQDTGTFQAVASYAGSNTLWPAQATAPLDLTPHIQTNGVVNAATFKAEAMSPGAWFTIYGQNLGSAGQWTSPNTLTLGGAGVSVCGMAAAISYNSGPVVANGTATWQVNALIPDGVAGQSSCPVVVTVSGLPSQAATVAIKGGILELFGFTSSAGAIPVVTHADYSLVGPVTAGLNPAKPGEAVIAWGTGDCAIPTVTVGGSNAPVTFSGRVAPGLCQVNFSVPAGLSGANSLQMSTSSSAYTLWVAP